MLSAAALRSDGGRATPPRPTAGWLGKPAPQPLPKPDPHQVLRERPPLSPRSPLVAAWEEGGRTVARLFEFDGADPSAPGSSSDCPPDSAARQARGRAIRARASSSAHVGGEELLLDGRHCAHGRKEPWYWAPSAAPVQFSSRQSRGGDCEGAAGSSSGGGAVEPRREEVLATLSDAERTLREQQTLCESLAAGEKDAGAPLSAVGARSLGSRGALTRSWFGGQASRRCSLRAGGSWRRRGSRCATALSPSHSAPSRGVPAHCMSRGPSRARWRPPRRRPPPRDAPRLRLRRRPTQRPRAPRLSTRSRATLRKRGLAAGLVARL